MEGAEGYEVILKQGSAKMRWTQTSNKKTIVTKSFKRYDDYFVYYSSQWDLSYHDSSEVSNPIYIKVRAYKTKKNGEKVYTKWNAEQIVEFPGE